MSTRSAIDSSMTVSRFPRAARAARTGVLTAVLVTVSTLAMAQDRRGTEAEPSFFESIGRWFEVQGDRFKSSFKDAGKTVENFGNEAAVAAKSTVEGAKDAAGAVARFPTARVVDGHEKCKNAPNGAPDCVTAATLMCKAKGFDSGKSADMTTAEVCPPQVYLTGRNSGPGCKTETFVSRALCQ
jgi:hypothetical protein